MIAIQLEGVQFGVMDVGGDPAQPDAPARLLQFLDPQSGIVVRIPLSTGACEQVATQLRGSPLVVADARHVPAAGGGVRY